MDDKGKIVRLVLIIKTGIFLPKTEGFICYCGSMTEYRTAIVVSLNIVEVLFSSFPCSVLIAKMCAASHV